MGGRRQKGRVGVKLYLVRHAQSTANVFHKINTALPGPPLTELGEKQAQALSEQLQGEPVVAVYASRATRAQQTAKPLATARSLEVGVLDGVHEVYVGDLEDRSDLEAIETFHKVLHPWTLGDLGVSMPRGENGYQVRERFFSSIYEVRARHADAGPDAVVVVVSHGGAIRLAAEWLSYNVTSEIADTGLIPNTGIVRLQALPDGGWQCLEWAGISLES